MPRPGYRSAFPGSSRARRAAHDAAFRAAAVPSRPIAATARRAARVDGGRLVQHVRICLDPGHAGVEPAAGCHSLPHAPSLPVTADVGDSTGPPEPSSTSQPGHVANPVATRHVSLCGEPPRASVADADPGAAGQGARGEPFLDAGAAPSGDPTKDRGAWPQGGVRDPQADGASSTLCVTQPCASRRARRVSVAGARSLAGPDRGGRPHRSRTQRPAGSDPDRATDSRAHRETDREAHRQAHT
jgi:hypothetical protein